MRIQPNFQAVRFSGHNNDRKSADILDDSAAAWATAHSNESGDKVNLKQRPRKSTDLKRESMDLGTSSSAVWGIDDTKVGTTAPETSSQRRKSSETTHSSKTQEDEGPQPKWLASEPESVALWREGFSAPSFPIASRQEVDAVDFHRKIATGRMRDDLVSRRTNLERDIRRTTREIALMALRYSWLAEKNDILRYGGVENTKWLDEILTIKHPMEQFADLELPKSINDGAQRIKLFSALRKKDYVWLMGSNCGLKPDPKSLRLQKIRTDISGSESEQIEKNKLEQDQLKTKMMRLRSGKLAPLQQQLEETTEGMTFMQEQLLRQVKDNI